MSSSSEADLKYPDDAKHLALLERQLTIFNSQVSSLQAFVESFKGRAEGKLDAIKSDGAAHAALLERRASTSSVLKALRKRIDDVEHAMVSLVGTDGMIHLESSMQEFVVVMTKISDSDHRAMALHLLLNKTTENCQRCFVSCEGLRILRRWMRAMQEEDRIEMLRTCLAVVRKLPFDEHAVRRSEIGKAIKKASKHKSGKEGVGAVREDAMAVMNFWKDELRSLTDLRARGGAPNGTAKTPLTERAAAIVLAYDKKMVTDHGVPVPNEAAVPVDTSEKKKPDPIVTETTKLTTEPDSNLKSPSSMDVDIPERPTDTQVDIAPPSAPTPLADPSPSSSRKRKSAASSDVTSKGKGSSVSTSLKRRRPKFENIDTASLLDDDNGGSDDDDGDEGEGDGAVDAIALSSSSSSSPSSPSARAGSSVLNLLKNAPKTVPTSQPAAVPLDVLDVEGTDAPVGEDDKVEGEEDFEVDVGPYRPDATALPGPGGLKKRDRAKKKTGLMWRDVEGDGHLYEMNYLVGNFHHVASMQATRQSVSVREKSKKQAAREKELNLNKMREVMKQSIAWIVPPLLSFPEEVNEIIRGKANEMETDERTAQSKRLKGVLEARYLDDSMIPADPEPPSSTVGPTEDDPIPVPWYQEDDSEDVQQSAQPSSSSTSAAPTSGQGGAAAYGAAPVGHAGAQDTAAIVNSLPPALRELPQEILLDLARDPSKLAQITNPDGSLNLGRVALLRMQAKGGAGTGAPSGATPHNRFARPDRGPPHAVGQLPSPSPPQMPDRRQRPGHFDAAAAGVGMGAGGMILGGLQPRGIAVGSGGMGGKPTPRIPCRNFNSPSGYCQFGDKCTFLHVKR